MSLWYCSGCKETFANGPYHVGGCNLAGERVEMMPGIGELPAVLEKLWIVAKPFDVGPQGQSFIAGPFTLRSEAERCVTTLAAQSLWRTIKITTSEP